MKQGKVVWALGQILRPFSCLMLVPAAVDFADGATIDALSFVATGLAAFLVGMLLVRRRRDPRDLSRVESIAVVANAWLLAAAFGALPYLPQAFAPVDAFFESMSGFTTTGSTIFQTHDFERLSRGLLLWRCMSQWLGGMGIIVLFVAVLPALAVAGRQMFFAEAPGPEEEALTPRIRHTASALWKLYIGLTALEALLLFSVGGMPLFDAVCHSFTTLAAGGFSPNGASLAGYGAAAQWVVIGFMFLAGSSFALQFRALSRPKVLAADTEFRTYALLALFAGLTIALLIAGNAGHGFEASLRHGLFQAISILTTTGYASEDFALWQPAPLMVLGVLMFIGGCAGSAAGGPKVVRFVVLAKFLAREVLVALHPRVVRVVRVGGRPVTTPVMRQIIGFFAAYLAIFVVVATLVALLENDIAVGFTGAIVTLGNIGPGFGAIGPMETFGELATASKLLFVFAMWVGRLEVLTVLVLLQPEVIRLLLARRRH